jgi:hypothetical protein
MICAFDAEQEEKKRAAARAQQAEEAGDGPHEDHEDAPAEELDAVELFKVCHTSRIKGLTDNVKDAIVSPVLNFCS